MPNVMHRTINAPTPQSKPAEPDQVRNNAGGYVYQISPEAALERFLILGTEGGSYYCREKEMTKQGMALVRQCVRDMEPSAYFALVERAAKTAPKRTYALWAISEALVSGDAQMKARVPAAVRNCVQTGTDLFELASYVRGRRGWGPTVQRAFDAILAELPEDKLALWAVKYRDRFGFTWRDLLRLQHTKAGSTGRDLVFGFMAGKWAPTPEVTGGFPVLAGFQFVKGVADEAEIIRIVNEYRLPWEALADEQRTDAVWKACLPNIGDRAVLRNVASFTRRGMDKDPKVRQNVMERIARSSKLHPINVLDALKTYQSGGTVGRSKGGTYTPNSRWLEAMEDALDRSFTEGVTSTGKRIYIGLDVSGSMGSPVAGSVVLSCREVGAALSLAFVRNEEEVGVFGFTSGGRAYSFRAGAKMEPLAFTRRTAFADAVKTADRRDFGGTDCALPMLDALQRRVKVDTFIVITDNETWAGNIHPMEALRKYRQEAGINAKLAVIGLTATRFSIADPKDPGTMDFVGFSSDLPRAVEAFMVI